ncbi:MAG: hypothetical protein B6241_00385 [Spirochaetaceae bacterium 4572_59]|nr:MAG: hypothetical protein B6241_00385 [Spirochaetaceae bacterium 4572_59]
MPAEQMNLDWIELFNEFPRGVALLDKDGHPLYVNSRIKGLFQIRRDTLEIRYIAAQGKWTHFLDAFLKKNSRQEEIVIAVPLKHGGQKWFAIRLIRNNKDSHIFLMEDDISDQHMREEQLRSSRDDAEKATKTKSDFLANMSHEIRTPIHTIIGMAELMDTTELDQEQDEYSSQIRFSADVLLSLINDILDFSKIEAGQLELDCTECNLQVLVEDSIDIVALEAHNKGVELGFYADPTLDLFIEADPTRLRQIIMNLVNNAVKFTTEGQVMIYLKKLDQNEQNTTIKFVVEDSGIGIPEEKQKKLFEAFTQADSSTTRRFGGTGLGLTICKNLVQKMGGSLEIQSSEGIGSEFFFTLSFPRLNPGVTILDKDCFGQDLNRISILLVDDNWKIREVLVNYLSSWGCRVEEAGSGREAFQKMKWKVKEEGTPYDICITDQLMPDIDGWQLASQVRAHHTLTQTALILMSLKAKGTEEAKMKLLGWFSAYVNKPIRKRDLWDKCIQALFPERSEPGELEELEELDRVDQVYHPEYSLSIRQSKVTGKVLIAEDHPVNRKLFEAILLKQGLEVVLAENGKIALEKAETELPDLIFMDCQMPVMNGYESTRQIREIGIHTPIIAVTANALKGEREKCLECGMNDFLPKPFKNKDIQPILQKWLNREERVEELNLLNDELPEEEGALEELHDLEMLEDIEAGTASLAVFDFSQALDTFMGDMELLISLLKPFKEQMDLYISQLEDPEVFADMEEVRSLGHAIKGSSRNLSMDVLGMAAEALEFAGRDGRREDAALAYKNVRTAYLQVLKSLEPYLEP